MNDSNYMEWILDLFDGYEHTCLFRQLMTIDFRWYVQLDANLIPCVRRFREKMGRDYDGPRGTPTVLEILAALAVECEDKIMHNDEFGNRTCQWFWMMLFNLGVNIYDDAHYTDKIAEEIDEKVNLFLDRCYNYHGDGSIFTCNNPYYDMRSAPLWEQLNWELGEEYADEFKMDC